MTTVVISPHNVVNYPEGGGHFWVYMQYAQGLRQLGCEVYWLESFRRTEDPDRDRARVREFVMRMERFGLGGKLILYVERPEAMNGHCKPAYINLTKAEAESVFRQADLLLNFHYSIDPELLAQFRRTALVDIDPGLLQFWISAGQLVVPEHDVYLTTGETVGRDAARFSDCGLIWNRIRPPISLDHWPYSYTPHSQAFTTVSAWWTHNSWITDGKDVYFENNKRISFLDFVTLPQRTAQVLELALFLGKKEHDLKDREILDHHGWHVRHSWEVASTPEMYRRYIQSSRGEFSCAKPSCMHFQNAWVSDRSLCYLASGKPLVVQNTGASSYLPNGEGMFRFSTMEEAVGSIAAINADYERHCRAAREIAETYFDALQILERVLEVAL